MLSDHEHNRALTREMIEAAAEYRRGNKDAGLRFALAGEQYVSALREHIQKENLVLFVMADNTLPASEEPELLANFHEVDRNKIGSAEIARLLTLLEKLKHEMGDGGGSWLNN